MASNVSNISIKPDNLNDEKKWYISVLSGLLFLIINSPCLYVFTNDLFSCFGLTTYKNNKPTRFGIILHTIVFILVVRGMMEIKID